MFSAGCNVKSVLGVGFAACVITWASAFGQSNLVLDTDEYHYEATFDPGRISAARLHELLLFSPYEFGVYGWKIDELELSTGSNETPGRLEKSAFATPLELCINTDPRYRPCGRRDISDPNFFENAEVNVGRNEQAVAALNRLNVPTELEGILQQFRDSLSFYSTIERTRLEYLRTGNLRVLSTQIGAIDPSTQCIEEIRELNVATTLNRRYELSRHAWHNCLNSAWQKIEPAYPQEAWRTFLRDYGIAEQFTNKPID
jgi:hypothetical protein